MVHINAIRTKKTEIVIAGAALLAGLFASVLALSGSSVKAAVGGPTCNVPADYATIQLAVDAAGCSTVKVAAGTYPENVNITRSVTVKGAKAGADVNGRTAAGPNESTVDGTALDTPAFTVNAANVTIDGFSISNANHGIGITIKTAGNNAVIKNNIVDNIGGVTYASNTVGVYLETGPDNVKVSDNKISNVQSVPSAQGILVGDSTSNNPSLGVLLDDNTISNITSINKGAYGIQLNNGAGSTATGYTTGKVMSNTIKNLTGQGAAGQGWAHGIGLEGDTPNLLVKYNRISNLTDGNPTPISDTVGITLEDNIFFFTVDANRNSIDLDANSYGIAVNPALTTQYPTLSADGTCNWWGAKNGPGPVGPGSGSKVSSGVDYKPWLKSNNLNGKCGDKGHSDYNDSHYGHGNDDKDRWFDSWDD